MLLFEEPFGNETIKKEELTILVKAARLNAKAKKYRLK